MSEEAGIREARNQRRRRKVAILISFATACLFATVSLCSGSSGIGPVEIFDVLLGKGTVHQQTVVVGLRLPHVLCALLGGVALACAGCGFQSTLRNPLASASTLGIAQGAAFGASVAIIALGAGPVGSATGAHEGVTFASPPLTAACAFAGAMASSLVIFAVSRLRLLTAESAVLTGVALSALFTGATALVQYFADDTQVAAVVFWTFGSLRRVGYPELSVMAVTTLATCVFFYLARWKLNAFESGEQYAHSIGIPVQRARLGIILAGTLASSSIIAFCGTINFIGLVAPHIMRRIVGGSYESLLPASAFAGASLLLASDLVASSIIPSTILPISSITAFLGAPLFVWLLIGRSERR